MAITLSALQLKVSALRNEFRTKGFWAGLFNYSFEFIWKRQFRKLGVEFPDLSSNVSDTMARSINKDSVANQGTSFFLIQKAFRHIPLLYKDISMLDIGCGSGKIMVVGMKRGFREVIGIDLDSQSLLQAEANCRRMSEYGSITGYSLHNTDATLFQIPPGINLIYLFNPFGMKTMEQVVKNIKAYTQKSSIPVYIIYMYPRFEYLFREEDGFSKIYASTFLHGSRQEMSIFLAGRDSDV